MNEKPIERLSYYNGQRLEADDLKLEQEYHIRVRRWLNKSLYSAGIAQGLEVQVDKSNLQQVIISPGLALDSEGREMILLEEARIQVVGQKSEKEGEPQGNYLYIQYREEKREEETDYCAPKNNGHKHGQIPWGGPSRVHTHPILGWSYRFPHESSGKVVLAQIELDNGCKVRKIYTGLRHYIGQASAKVIRHYSLEGEREIAAIPVTSGNPITVTGKFYFHVQVAPQSVTLYLHGDSLSQLHYTELGEHKHPVALSGALETTDETFPEVTVKVSGEHTHAVSAFITPGGHNHYGPVPVARGFYLTDKAEQAYCIFPTNCNTAITPEDKDLGDEQYGHLKIKTDNSAHDHSILQKDSQKPLNEYKHKHRVNPNVAETGVQGTSSIKSRSGDIMSYADDVHILLDNKDITQEVINWINTSGMSSGWTKLGDGQSDHNFVTSGTGAIVLNNLPGITIGLGEHSIEFRVDPKTIGGQQAANGGKVHYNLYIG